MATLSPTWLVLVRRLPTASERSCARHRRRTAGVTLSLAAGLVVACGSSGAPPGGSTSLTGMHEIADIPLPGSTARLDYQSLDAAHHRLYIAHLGDGTVAAVDTETQTVVGTVPGVPGVHGMLAVPELGRVYATATDRNEVAVIDAQSLRVISSVPAGDFPDGLAYDPADHRLFVSDEHGGTDTVIDTDTNRRLTTIDLGGDVGNTQYDAASHVIVVAIGAGNKVVVIDPARVSVLHRYDVPGCDGAHGLYLDSPDQVAYVACEGNANLVALDLRSGRTTPTEIVGDTPDVLAAYDPGPHQLYVAAESGTLTIFQADGMHLRRIAQGFAGPNAHTVAVDTATHRIFLPIANDNGRPVLRVMAPGEAAGTGTRSG